MNGYLFEDGEGPRRFGRALRRLAAGLAVAGALAGCAAMTSTPYQPLSSSSRTAGGYSDVRIGERRYAVTFAGNRLTSREQVETFLLYRAAELTLERGYDWFMILDHAVEHRVEREVWPDPYYRPSFAAEFGYWRPYWRYYGRGSGWHSWYPYYGDPFWADRIEARTVERFEATAQIEIGRGPTPARDHKVFSARAVTARLGPTVRPPAD